VVEHRDMSRALSSLPLALLLACGPKGSGGTTPPTETAPPTHAAPAAAPAAALDAEIIRTASTAAEVRKMKVRVDADGNIVKQSLYHGQADALPAKVHELAKTRFPNGKVVYFETELYADRGRVYEVEVDDAGKPCEVAATPEGVEIYVECEVDPASLAAELKASIEKLAPGGKLLEAETKKGPDIDEVTVEVEAGGRELYVRMKPDGTIIQTLRRIPAIIEVPLP
jgi:hypothetical protein